MTNAQSGRTGCGCLIFVLVLCILIAAACIHPFSLRLMAGRLSYSDNIIAADVILVPRFSEDKNGELFTEAFREYWAGNGKSILVEEDKVFGFSMKDIVSKMAKERGVKENAIRAISTKGNDKEKIDQIKGFIKKQGIKRILVIAPSYCSRRLHYIFRSDDASSKKAAIFLIKSTDVSYFEKENWWKSGLSRSLAAKELYRLSALYISHIIHRDEVSENDK
jgi:hypothetical protein